MKVVIDDKIPYIKGLLEPFADVVYLPGAKTTPQDVRDADALITRTRTRCNKDLLNESKVKYIATATIGYDHIDTDYCRENNIQWSNAPGCNAESVNQYIASALFSYSMKKRTELAGQTIGIVGVGNVGSKVARLCEIIGMKVLLNDPPREREEGPEQFVSLEQICEEADIISFHVPLNMSGQDATFHMVEPQFIESLQKKPLLINSCRGEVFDTEAVKTARKEGNISGLIIDCWENEPGLDKELLSLVDYGTPHIAGYSKDGKANGTRMSVDAIGRFFSLPEINWNPDIIEKPATLEFEIDGRQRREYSILAEAVLSTYDIENDHDSLIDNPEDFEKLRGEYPVRREFHAYTVEAKSVKTEVLKKLKQLNFNMKLSETHSQ